MSLSDDDSHLKLLLASIIVGAALENFPAQKRKKKFWFHVRTQKNEANKTSLRTIRATPKIGDFYF
jgi:hypothetical protein